MALPTKAGARAQHSGDQFFTMVTAVSTNKFSALRTLDVSRFHVVVNGGKKTAT
jgi:hypothetical protein